MAAFLTYVFLRGPRWLRAFVWLTLLLCFPFGCLQGISNIRNAMERPVPAHVRHVRSHPASFIRR